MKTVDARTVVVLGRRPGSSAAELLADVAYGDEALLVALGRRPTPAQQVIVADALALAADRRFVLTAESVANEAALRERLSDPSAVRVFASRSERRRWNLA